MKQELVYEPTWKRVLSEQDHDLIEKIFERTPPPTEGEIQFIPIRAAYNHRGDLIATALIQNSKNSSFSVYELTLIYKENGTELAKHVFTIPRLHIPPHTTMPWSFLFPKEAQDKKASLIEWELVWEPAMKG
ncbi:SLAP domain-containing protein [Bacillus taeanensis]|nr:SLAP domain-containing protein [Bacillus taeanensis]